MLCVYIITEAAQRPTNGDDAGSNPHQHDEAAQGGDAGQEDRLSRLEQRLEGLTADVLTELKELRALVGREREGGHVA